MLRHLLLALVAALPVVSWPLRRRIAARLVDAPRRLPDEASLGPALDALGGEVVRFRSRDGTRLQARWLLADGGRAGAPGSGEAPVVEPPSDATPDREAAIGEAAWQPDPREAILLLHGWSGSIAPDLVEFGPFLRRTARVLGLDFGGHGESDPAPTTFGVREVEDIAGALGWLGERGIRRVALVGSSMGGISAIAAVAVLGDGRLASADVDPDAPAGVVGAPRPRVVGIVGDSVTPDVTIPVGRRIGGPFGRFLAGRAFDALARRIGADPRQTQPIRVIGLLEDLPLLLIHGIDDRTVPIRDGRRLAAAAPAGSRHVEIAGADHSAGHRADPGRYEAEVESFLRDAFRGTRDGGHGAPILRDSESGA